MLNHLAIIADGNRRWSEKNNFPINTGYMQGLVVIENCCEWCISNNVPYLTIYCFSTENWNRPQDEVDTIMNIARWYAGDRREWYINMGIKVEFIGRKDRLAKDIVQAFYDLESNTSDGDSLTLRICADYGGRDEIVRAVKLGAKTESEISNVIMSGIPDPDIILRTGGEQRLSNFMLWQAAYSELFFSPTLFPDLNSNELSSIKKEYNLRTRRYGV